MNEKLTLKTVVMNVVEYKWNVIQDFFKMLTEKKKFM